VIGDVALLAPQFRAASQQVTQMLRRIDPLCLWKMVQAGCFLALGLLALVALKPAIQGFEIVEDSQALADDRSEAPSSSFTPDHRPFLRTSYFYSNSSHDRMGPYTS